MLHHRLECSFARVRLTETFAMSQSEQKGDSFISLVDRRRKATVSKHLNLFLVLFKTEEGK